MQNSRYTMQNSRYYDPWGDHSRALERNIIKYRSLEMVLVVHYVEELKRFLIRSVKSLDRFDRNYNKENPRVRLKTNATNPYYPSLKAWHQEGLISRDEKKELAELTGYRNDIAHRVHELNADLSTEKFHRNFVRELPNRFSSYRYEAVEKLQKYIQDLPERYHKKYRVGFLDYNHSMFRTTENVLKSELEVLRKKINRLSDKRREEIDALNKEFKLIHEKFIKEKSPRWVFQTYDDGRFTPRGQEICYRLFDEGFSTLAIAHSFGLLMPSIRKRKRMWENIGGKNRPNIIFDDLPIRRSPYRYEYD